MSTVLGQFESKDVTLHAAWFSSKKLVYLVEIISLKYSMQVCQYTVNFVCINNLEILRAALTLSI